MIIEDKTISNLKDSKEAKENNLNNDIEVALDDTNELANSSSTRLTYSEVFDELRK